MDTVLSLEKPSTCLSLLCDSGLKGILCAYGGNLQAGLLLRIVLCNVCCHLVDIFSLKKFFFF